MATDYPSPVTVLFVAGSHRSGSTILERILDQLPGFHSVGESVQVWASSSEGAPCGCGRTFRACPFWEEVGRHAFGGWDPSRAEGLARLQRSVDRIRHVPSMIGASARPRYRRRMNAYGRALATLYRAVREASGARVVVDSTKRPSTAHILRQVPDVDLRVIHLIRDGRAVAHAWTRPPAAPAPPGEPPLPFHAPSRTSLHWMADNLLVHLLGLLGVRTSAVRYEALVLDPRGEVARALEELGLPVPDGDLSFIHGRRIELKPGHSAAGNPVRFRQGSVELVSDEAWRSEVVGVRGALVSGLTWPLRAVYGYSGRGNR